MDNYKKEGFRKGNSGFGGKARFGGGNKHAGGNRGPRRDFGGTERMGEERQMFKATCSSCRQTCEVPFRPTNGKPVFCKDCFAENSSRDERFGGRSESRGNDFKRSARPTHEERPHRHEEVRVARDNGMEEVKRQLTNLESKMDYILRLIKENTDTKSETVSLSEKTEKVSLKPTKLTKAKSVKKAPAKKKAVAKKAK